MTQQSPCILIADDEPLARQRLKRLLLDSGFIDIVAATHGGEAVTLAQEHRPDIVMLDVRMPVLDGIEVAKQVKSDSRCCHAEFIFTTAYDEYALPAFDVSASGYLLKPINQLKMQAALDIAIERAAPRLDAQTQEHIPCQHKGRLQLIALNDVRVLLAEHKYVTLYHRQGVALVDASLKQLERDFPQHLMRIHRNALINKCHLQALEPCKPGHYQVIVKDVTVKPLVSRRWLSPIRQLLKRL